MPDTPGQPDQDAAVPDAQLLAFPDTEDRRLRRAMRALDSALDEQRSAVRHFRAQLDALKTAVGRLGDSAQDLGVALAEAAAETARAQAAAQQLLATADAMEHLARP